MIPRITLASLIALLAWLGHRLVFAQFQGYDDEGYLLMTVQQFLAGRPLYDEVYTQYGPAYYLWQEILRGVLGVPLTHEATRIVTLCVWLAAAVLTAVPVWHLTRRAALTGIGVALSFVHLSRMTFEPGHPQELALLGVLAAVALAIRPLAMQGRLGIGVAVGLGVLAAIVTLTKVNVGLFLTGALTLALARGLPKSPMRVALVGAAAPGAFACVPVLLSAGLARADVVSLLGVVWVGLAALLVADSKGASDRADVSARELAAALAGFVVTVGVVVFWVLAHGSSMWGVIDGVLIRPGRFGSIIVRPLVPPPHTALMSMVALVVLLFLNRAVTPARRGRPLKLAFALFALLVATAKLYGLLVALMPLLVWLMVGADDATVYGGRTARRLLGLASLLLMLQLYPLPGTQVVLATLFIVPLGLIVLADAERARRVSASITPAPLGQRVVFAALGIAVAGVVASRIERTHAQGTPLRMPGADAVHASERDVATYHWLAANMHANCDTFLTAPGLNSLHFWTAMPPVSTMNTTLWPVLLDAEQQSRMVAAATAVRGRLCVAWEPRKMETLDPRSGGTAQPLRDWIARVFERRGGVGKWEFHVRRGSTARLVHQGVWQGDGSLAVDLPGLDDGPVLRLTVADLDAGRILGDTTGETSVTVLDERERAVEVRQGLDASRSRRIVLRGLGAPSTPDAFVVLRLRSADGRLLALVPVATAAPTDASYDEGPYPPAPPE